MATSEGEVRLKHLGFVKVLAINVVFVVLKLYGFAKYMSGPVQSTVEMVERAVIPVLKPLYNLFKRLFNYILRFLDNKVDAIFNILDKHAPRIVKSITSNVLSIVKKALDLMHGANGISHAGDISKEAFDERTPPIVKDIVSKTGSMVKKTSDLVQEAMVEGPIAAISQAGKISEEASHIFDEHALPIAKDVVSKTNKASDLVQEATVKGPFAGISFAGKVSKEASNIFDVRSLPIPKGVGSIVKKTSDLVKESTVDSKEGSHIFDKGALSIAKGVGSMVKKTSDLVMEAPSTAISNADKISKEASHIFDGGALSLAKGVGSMVKKTSDLVQEATMEGPGAAISYAGKISEKASNIFDEHAPSIAKDLVSKAGSMVDKASNLVQEAATKGPFEAISQVGEMSKEFAVRQMVMVWYKANQDSFLNGVLEIVLPIVVYLLDKYNILVKYLKEKGWSSLFSYIPLIPLEEMEKTLKQVEEALDDARRSSKSG